MFKVNQNKIDYVKKIINKNYRDVLFLKYLDHLFIVIMNVLKLLVLKMRLMIIIQKIVNKFQRD